MSDVNPVTPSAPPADPPAPPVPPAPVAAPSVPAPTPVPAGNAAPDLTGALGRLEQVLTGLPERTANAVREVSPQHVPNPTANPAAQPGQPGATPPPGGGKSHAGPSRFAKWFHGIQD